MTNELNGPDFVPHTTNPRDYLAGLLPNFFVNRMQGVFEEWESYANVLMLKFELDGGFVIFHQDQLAVALEAAQVRLDANDTYAQLGARIIHALRQLQPPID